MTAFTRGPFEQGLENDHIRIWTVMPSAIRYGIADICMNRTVNSTGPSLAEREIANLLTAAPDLLAALEKLVSDQHSHPKSCRCPWCQARAAIIKAKEED